MERRSNNQNPSSADVISSAHQCADYTLKEQGTRHLCSTCCRTGRVTCAVTDLSAKHLSGAVKVSFDVGSL